MEPISEERQSELSGTAGAAKERNWVPLALAGGLVASVVAAGLLLADRPKPANVATPITAAADPYAVDLALSNVVMSESGNLAGGKVTYVDGHITNAGPKTVTGITVQVLFRSYTKEVAQNETLPLKLIRMREPYIDTEPVAADPIKSGKEQDFRLIFDKVSPDWAGALPEIKIVHVDLQ